MHDRERNINLRTGHHRDFRRVRHAQSVEAMFSAEILIVAPRAAKFYGRSHGTPLDPSEKLQAAVRFTFQIRKNIVRGLAHVIRLAENKGLRLRPVQSASTAFSVREILPLSNTPDPCPQIAFHRSRLGSNKASSLARLADSPDKFPGAPRLPQAATEIPRDFPPSRTPLSPERPPPDDRRGFLQQKLPARR